MSDHVLELLGAYLDGELHNGRLRKVEAHLDDCQDCMAEYQLLQALSAKLHAAPLPDFPSPERFATEVTLRLPRTQDKPLNERVFEIGWWLVPVGLVVAWIFLSTTLLVSNMVIRADELGLLDSASARLVPSASNEAYWSGALGQFGLLTGNSLQWAETMESFTRVSASQIFWQVAIALLYLSWLAIWWARHTLQGSGQSLDSGSRPTVK